MNRRRRRKPKYIRIILAIILLLGVFYYVLNLSIFNINKVEIVGNKLVQEQDILGYSEISLNQSIVFIDKSEIITNIKRIPIIKDVAVKWRPIKTLKLEIAERIPVAYVYDGSKYFLIDNEGIAFQKVDNVNPGLMAIKGLDNLSKIKIGSSIYESNSEESYLLNTILSKDYYSIVKSVELSEKAQIVLTSDIEVAFGSYDNVEYKLAALNEIYKKILDDDHSDRAVMILMEEGPDPILVYD